MKKVIFTILKIAAVLYGVLFLIFFFDLDGKLLYYFWEPNAISHFDKMKRKDNTVTPYAQKKNVSEDF